VTYSIVARDPQTGLLGVAVQTAMFAAGASVPWARAGVGAVATQAIAEAAYGPRCLDAIQAGASALAALAQAQAADEAAVLRQVGVVAADGSVAARRSTATKREYSRLVIGGMEYFSGGLPRPCRPFVAGIA